MVSEHRERDDSQIEVTPEMIEAGVAAYKEWVPDDFGWTYTEMDLVRRIFIFMIDARS